jgi:hypothetical protein
MERRQIIGALGAAACTGGIAVTVAGLVNHLPVLDMGGPLLLAAGLVAFGRLFVTAPKARPTRARPLVLGPLAEPSPIKLEVGEDGELFSTTSARLYATRRTFNVRVSNTLASKTIRKCRVRITEVSPPTDYAGPWLLADEFDLPAGDHRLVAIATFGEAREPDKFDCADSFIVVQDEGQNLTLDADVRSTLTIRATGDDVAFCELRCDLWVDPSGRLHIKAVG